MVCLIVDDQDVLGIGHLSQYLTGVGFIAFGPPFIHTPALFDGLLAVPRQRLPVGDQHLALAQLVHQTDGDHIELCIVIILAACLQYLQTAF